MARTPGFRDGSVTCRPDGRYDVVAACPKRELQASGFAGPFVTGSCGSQDGALLNETECAGAAGRLELEFRGRCGDGGEAVNCRGSPAGCFIQGSNGEDPGVYWRGPNSDLFTDPEPSTGCTTDRQCLCSVKAWCNPEHGQPGSCATETLWDSDRQCFLHGLTFNDHLYELVPVPLRFPELWDLAASKSRGGMHGYPMTIESAEEQAAVATAFAFTGSDGECQITSSSPPPLTSNSPRAISSCLAKQSNET